MQSAKADTYTYNEIIDALIYADTYRSQAGLTGNFTLIDRVVDAERIMNIIDITDKHRNILHMRWILGMKQWEVAVAVGMTQSGICKVEEGARIKIEAVLAEWEAYSYV